AGARPVSPVGAPPSLGREHVPPDHPDLHRSSDCSGVFLVARGTL
ncbi:MAG: hypothetical protein AVDCRST_MAG59-4360, partial [uncultured Thermomicrobiales bacterium]